MREKVFKYKDERIGCEIYDNNGEYQARLWINTMLGEMSSGRTLSDYAAASLLIDDVDGMLESLTAVRSELQEHRRTC